VQNVRLSTVGAWSAVATFVAFVLGIALMATSGVQVLIPETGAENVEWLADADEAGDAFVIGAWLVVLGGAFALVALVGFYDALKDAGRVLVLGPVLTVVGFALVELSHILPIAIAQELAPRYLAADGAARESIEATSQTLAALSLATNYAGDVLIWAVVVPLYAVAILRTRVVARWIGWLGLVAGVFAGWLGILSPLSSTIEGITTIGFFAFFLFVLSFGIALLRRPASAEAAGAPVLPAA
jgi:hypothetical protein